VAAEALIVSPGPRSAGPAGAAARIPGAAALKPTADLAMCYTHKAGVMNTVTDTFNAFIQVGDCPTPWRSNRTQRRVYTGNSDSHNDDPIAAATNTAGLPIAVGAIRAPSRWRRTARPPGHHDGRRNHMTSNRSPLTARCGGQAAGETGIARAAKQALIRVLPWLRVVVCNTFTVWTMSGST
jgi:hypothetical protein